MASSPSKEATPAGSEAKAPGAPPTFNERDQKLLIAAMLSLKSGPPEIDYQRFVKAGEFNTLKTAQNSWGKLKQKLNSLAPVISEEGEGEGGDGGATPKSATKPKVTPRKRGKKADTDAEEENAGEGDGSPSKKTRKSPAKTDAKNTGAIKEEEGEDVDGVPMED